VILDDKTTNKPKINYPCNWGFKVIGTDKEKLESCIFDIMAHRNYKCREGNISSKGKFITINADCEVSSQEERDELFKAFRDHCDVKIVI
jgi:putative lipoic acid-binding regulatory protein